MATTYGYARVSTKGQDLKLQQEALAKAGCAKVFYEKASGARSDNRPQLCRLLKVVDVGDVVIVTRLDPLARSTRDLLNTIHELNEAGAKFKSIADVGRYKFGARRAGADDTRRAGGVRAVAHPRTDRRGDSQGSREQGDLRAAAAAQPAAEAARRGQVRRGRDDEGARGAFRCVGADDMAGGARSGIVRRLLALALALLISNALETSAWTRGHGGGHGGSYHRTSHSTAHHSLNWRIRHLFE